MRLHKRECRDLGCAGRTYIWWITRHPESHPDIANQLAIDYVKSRQCCEILETRLVEGSLHAGPMGSPPLTWLPGEQRIHNSRTFEEKCQLLGRSFLPSESSGTSRREEKYHKDFLEVKKSVPKVPRTKKNRPAVSTRPVPAPASDTVDWVDALTTRREW